MKSLLIAFTLIVAIAYCAEFPICTKPNYQKHPEIVFDGTRYFVVYDSVADIWGARIDINGNVTRFLIASGASEDSTPAVAYDGTNFFVVWTRGPSIYGAIVNQSNQVIQGPFYVPINGYFHPVIGFTNSRFLIVTSHYVLIPQGTQGILWGIIYNTSYSPVGNNFIIATTPSSTEYLGNIGHGAVGADGTQFMVSYPYSYSPPPNISWQNTLSFKFVTTSGGVGSEFVIRGVGGSTTHHDTLIFYPSDIAFDGVKYFISYHFAESGYYATGAYNNVYGRVVNTDGSWGSDEISIATQSNINEFASAVAAEDRNFFVTWQDYRAGSNYNLYGKHYDESGAAASAEVTVTTASNTQVIPHVAFDGFNNLVVWQDYRNGNWDIYGNFIAKGLTTDDGLALAYNGNRHLARKPNTNEFHMVYTDRGKVVYRFLEKEGSTDWTTLFILGDGKFPTITLSSTGLPYVTWTDNAGGLWFRYQTSAGVWSQIYHLYTPWPNTPYLNSPPSIATVINFGVVCPHILVTRTGRIAGNGVAHLVEDFTFPVNDPGSGTFQLLEQRPAPPDQPYRSFPSIVKDDYDTLHAVWQRGISDTIAYAKRYRLGTWNVQGAVLGNEGLVSSHPFPEPYGNIIYAVWQKDPPTEEVYKGQRTLGSPDWTRSNLSITATTRSIYPVSAYGFFTVFADEYNSPWDVYYKVNPADPLVNISQTSGVTSQYPHSVAKYTVNDKFIYTAWLEGNASPYTIMFKKMLYQIPPDFAYISSTSGHNPASPYLIARDGFIDAWQIPVDYGYSTVTYRFPLLPEFKYKLKVTAYHEGSGEWWQWVRIDGHEQHLMKYDAFTPLTAEMWIPPAFYQDTVIEVVFERVAGDFATAGPIEIYQYEYEEGEGGGPQDFGTKPLNAGKSFLNVCPNPAHNEFSVAYTLSKKARVNLSLYDAAGRLIDVLVNAVQEPGFHSKILSNTGLSQGIYFIRLDTDEASTVKKVIFLR